MISNLFNSLYTYSLGVACRSSNASTTLQTLYKQHQQTQLSCFYCLFHASYHPKILGAFPKIQGEARSFPKIQKILGAFPSAVSRERCGGVAVGVESIMSVDLDLRDEKGGKASYAHVAVAVGW